MFWNARPRLELVFAMVVDGVLSQRYLVYWHDFNTLFDQKAVTNGTGKRI